MVFNAYPADRSISLTYRRLCLMRFLSLRYLCLRIFFLRFFTTLDMVNSSVIIVATFDQNGKG
jgi:hypothetical protein